MNRHDQNNQDGNPESRKRRPKDPTAAVLKEQWLERLRQSESREGDFDQRLQARKARYSREIEARLKQEAQLESDYQHDNERIRRALEVCEQDLDAAHRTASRICGEIGIRYVPGVTSEEDVLRVPCLTRAEAAERKNLRNGAQLRTDRTNAVKVVTAVLCAVVSSVCWGALICGLNLKRPLANLPGAVFALLLGLATSFVVWRFLTRLWGPIGTKEGIGRAKEEIRVPLLAALTLSAVVVIGLMALDALGLIRVNAAKAELSPVFAIPLWLALIAAGFVNLSYCGATAYSSYADAYNDAADGVVAGVIRADKDEKVEQRKKKVLIQGALDALGQVRIVEARTAKYKAELKQIEIDFNQNLTNLLATLPEEPAGYTPEEETELAALRDKVTVAKERYDAHLASRGINFSVEDTANEEVA